MSSVSQDNWRRNDTSQHGKCMLKSKQKSEEDGHAIVKSKEGCCTTGLLHERKVRPEKEAIVVCSDKPISE